MFQTYLSIIYTLRSETLPMFYVILV